MLYLHVAIMSVFEGLTTRSMITCSIDHSRHKSDDKTLLLPFSTVLTYLTVVHIVVVVGYPTPSEGWGHGRRPWSPRSRATPQGLDQRVRSWTVQNEMRGVLGRVSAGRILDSANPREIRT